MITILSIKCEMVFIHPEYHIINAEAGANNVNHTNASNYNCVSQGIEL